MTFLLYWTSVVGLVLGLCLGVVPSVADYVLSSISEYACGYNGLLTFRGDGATSTPYGLPISPLAFNITLETADRVRIRITDPSDPQRWEVPFGWSRTAPLDACASWSSVLYTVHVGADPFFFAVVRNADQEVLFNTSGLPFEFKNQFLTVGTRLPNGPSLYGLGERIHPFKLSTDDFTYVLWNADRANVVDTDLYGSHPFYLDVRQGGRSAHGVFLLNSNAMDVVLSQDRLQYHVIGGILDFYVFVGPSAEKAVQQYHQLIGTPALPAAWVVASWGQSRWGYSSVEALREVVANYSMHSLPLDVIWSDIDYMDEYKIFTTDPVRFPVGGLNDLIDSLHAAQQRYVVIIDPGVKVEPGYEPYDSLMSDPAAFIRKNASTSSSSVPATGTVWPGLTVFVDYSSEAGRRYWTDHVQSFVSRVHVDGLWCDMNEPSNSESFPECSRDSPEDYPPYVPGLVLPLSFRTLCPSSAQSLGSMYNLHNLFGFLESTTTAMALRDAFEKRPFVLTRSSFPGSGRLLSKWTGDNVSWFSSMKSSIAGILNMNLFGISMVGADICGFSLDTTVELCSRWTALGSFYPFARNHNDKGRRPQEPYALGEQVMSIARSMIRNRYALNNYWYTLFFDAHRYGGTVVRPVFFEQASSMFAEDLEGLLAVDTQFMVGSALMVIPVLEEGARAVRAAIPRFGSSASRQVARSVWFDYWTGKAVPTNDSPSGSAMWQVLDAPIETIPVLFRAGNILVLQEAGQTVLETRQHGDVSLLLALDWTGSVVGSGRATGRAIFDDGESLGTLENGLFAEVAFVAEGTGVGSDGAGPATSMKLTSEVVSPGYGGADHLLLKSARVLGVSQPPKLVLLNGQPLSMSTVRWDADIQSLLIFDLPLHAVSNWTLEVLLAGPDSLVP